MLPFLLKSHHLERNENFSSYNYGEPPKNIYAANGILIYYIYDNWSVDLIELNVNRPKKTKDTLK